MLCTVGLVRCAGDEQRQQTQSSSRSWASISLNVSSSMDLRCACPRHPLMRAHHADCVAPCVQGSPRPVSMSCWRWSGRAADHECDLWRGSARSFLLSSLACRLQMGTPDEVGGRGGLRLPGLRPPGIEDERGVGCTSFCGVVLW